MNPGGDAYRQIVLDTETTGMEPDQGHRIIEIGAVELIGRRPTSNVFHRYLNPERAVDEGAERVHGLGNDFLSDKPVFADVADAFLAYIDGAELIIHNAPFDVAFIDHEFAMYDPAIGALEHRCTVTDSLVLARRMHPGQRCSLDALCRRYEVDGSRRELHGALLDAELLARVYLAMTGGQEALSLEEAGGGHDDTVARALAPDRPPLRVPAVPEADRTAHEQLLARIRSTCADTPVPWPEDRSGTS